MANTSIIIISLMVVIYVDYLSDKKKKKNGRNN